MMTPWPVPPSWQWTTIGDLAEVVGGGTPSTKDASNFGGEIPWITPADLSGYRNKFISRGERNITKKGLDGSGARLMPAGTVLFSSRAPIGYVAIAANPVATNQGFKSFVLKDENVVSPDFLYYYLQRGRQLAIRLSSGTTFPEISGAKARLIPIPIPPRPEQDRIVAEIEKQFTRIDAARTAIRATQRKIQVLRNAVLSASCRGMLVELESAVALREGRTYQSACDLLRAAGQTNQPSDAPSVALPDGWVWVRAATLLPFVTSGSRGWAKFYANEGPVFLRIGNLDHGTIDLDLRSIQRVQPPQGAEGERTAVRTGDILISITADVGMVGLVPDSIDRAFVNQHIALARPASWVNARWLAWFLASPAAKSQMRARDRGATKMGLGLDDIRQLWVPMPPIAEQDRIVAEIERRLSLTEECGRAVENTLRHTDGLRSSILRSAFNGTLVATALRYVSALQA